MFAGIIKKMVDNWVSHGIVSESDRDIYEYGMDLVLFSLLNIAAILVTSIIINQFAVSLVLLLTVTTLQSFGGGYHAKTHLRCFLIMYIGWFVFIMLLPLVSPIIVIPVIIVSIIAVFALAPVSHRNVNLSYNQHQKMKRFVRIAAVGFSLICAALSWLFPDTRQIGASIAVGIGTTALSMVIAKCKELRSEY